MSVTSSRDRLKKLELIKCSRFGGSFSVSLREKWSKHHQRGWQCRRECLNGGAKATYQLRHRHGYQQGIAGLASSSCHF
ncbi:hypothetical protein M5689_007802 [Euphorbia peplus]|nr:hypothetical protein M5689_007802 [Euphorbia peplus]